MPAPDTDDSLGVARDSAAAEQVAPTLAEEDAEMDALDAVHTPSPEPSPSPPLDGGDDGAEESRPPSPPALAGDDRTTTVRNPMTGV